MSPRDAELVRQLREAADAADYRDALAFEREQTERFMAGLPALERRRLLSQCVGSTTWLLVQAAAAIDRLGALADRLARS